MSSLPKVEIEVGEECYEHQGTEEIVDNYEITYEEATQEQLELLEANCLVCRRILDLNVEATVDVYDGYTSHSRTLLADVIKDLIICNPVTFNTTLLCMNCYSLVDRVDALHSEFTNIRTELRTKMYDLIGENYVNDCSQTYNLAHADVNIIHTSEDVLEATPIIKIESEEVIEIQPIPAIQSSKFSLNNHVEIWVSGGLFLPSENLGEYTCFFCFKKYNKKMTLIEHFDNIHGKKSHVECRLCNLEFTGGLKKFVAHMAKNHLPDEIRVALGHLKVRDGLLRLSGEKLKKYKKEDLEKRRINCLKCDVCVKEEMFEDHISVCHPSDGESFIKCHVCNEAVPKRNFNRHLRERHAIGKPIVCGQCGMQFTKRHRMVAHQRRVHNVGTKTKEKEFECQKCWKRFYTKYDVKRHLRLVHENVRPFVCHTCAATFKNRADLNRHFLDHSGIFKPFICEICNKAFTRSTHVKKHLRVVHKMECNSRLNDTLNPYALPIKILTKE